MDSVEYPEFIRKLPQADLPFEGMTGFLIQGESGQVVLFESEVEAHVPAHSHGSQWGVVTGGKMDLRIGEDLRTYLPGDCYFIAAGTEHEAKIYPGFKCVDVFEDTDRYHPK
ncbi:MAG: cupin domain-containing protein [Planctomycetota bacterium]|nr:MAG: cupin domain-containing protein [Planctomycetota bacterium]